VDLYSASWWTHL